MGAGFKAARSVHLGYPSPDAELYHQEMIIEKSVNGSYFMAAGWDTGYFGLQQLDSSTNTVVIFSVWDPTAGDDPKSVQMKDRVEVLHQAPDVRIKRFGGEGTGGQCMAPWAWRVGETNRFIVRAEIQGTKTSYSAFIWHHGRQDWKHLATFRTRTGGRPLNGLYSFVEDFRRDGKSVHELRRARFRQSWVQNTAHEWVALTKARFTASGAEWESKDNIDAGLEGDGFYLATGGQITMSKALKTVMELSQPTGLGAIPAAPVLPAP